MARKHEGTIFLYALSSTFIAAGGQRVHAPEVAATMVCAEQHLQERHGEHVDILSTLRDVVDDRLPDSRGKQRFVAWSLWFSSALLVRVACFVGFLELLVTLTHCVDFLSWTW